MKMNMGVVVGGPALAAVVIAGGLAWATIFAAKSAAPDPGELAHACAGERDRTAPCIGQESRPSRK
jgi:hypothetical protein